MPRSTPQHTSTYLLRMEPEQKARLESKALAAGIPLSEAMREGTERYLDGLLDEDKDESLFELPDGAEEEFIAAVRRANRLFRGE